MKMKSKSMHGRIRAEAFGALPESLVNAAAATGLELWNVERKNENTLSFEICESGLDTLRELAGRCYIELSIIHCAAEKRRVLKKRAVFVIMCMFCGMGLMLSSLFIWKIEIYGAHHISRAAVMRALEDSGIYVGRFWPGIKADEVRSVFMPKLPEVGWMTVNIKGSRAVVLINERLEKPEIYKESAAADLVAEKTGLLRRISVLSGKAEAEAGQAVTAGEKLASGRLESIMGRERLVRARGSAMADTWYEIDAVCPEEMDIKSYTGRVRHRFSVVFGKRRINFYISSGKAIDECDKIINDYNLGIKGHFALPLRFIHETILPYESESGPGYDKAAMGRLICSELEARTEGQLLQRSLTESFSRGLYVLTLRAHCVENIAMTQEILS